MARHSRTTYRCSFCGKSQEQVHRLIAGPGGVYICNECVELCDEIIGEERPAESGINKFVRYAFDRIYDRYAENPAQCPLCREALPEDDAGLIVATADGASGEGRAVIWRCHKSCLDQGKRLSGRRATKTMLSDDPK